MRITAGRFKGRKLVAPRGKTTRPVLSRVRSALMDVLGERLRDARVLDLFAGSGGFIFEVLSRGAESAVAVDLSRDAVQVIRQNAGALGVAAAVRVVRGDALRVTGDLAARGLRFDLIFVPPPYWQGLQPRALQALDTAGLLAPGGLVLVQRDRKERYPEPELRTLAHTETRRWGNTVFELYGARESEAGGSSG
jgi:16S rRNA (guanine(966)-N(2))-methyltransferase RsmD